ncbi:DUF1206 domain-containing protein [Cohnella hashimotonis]|uniref:DUF1206 domain-containing protein n=1 Tax=Cohnella hashimotonis TaxID=2826895 RepID=A0ABT6TG50_9BACL|nr:DUF1206 domain-containing protein [Cohnella hashimotonis]MDI4645810.1 DUF1206 domain-containing protein [Cohnella hashimotonis]
MPAIDKFARAGYLAKGTVYIMIGALAMMTAVGHRKETSDTNGAIETIGAQPLGGILLLILAVGLAGFSAWRFVQAFADPDGEGGDIKGILVRASRFGVGIFYAVITYHTAKTILGDQPSSGNKEQTLTAILLQQPLGATLIAAAGLGFAIYGIIEIVKAIRNSFTDSFKLNEIKPAMYRPLLATAKFGLCARGVVFGLIGYFLVRTAVFSDPEETKGLDDALAELALQPHGRWLLGAAAFGFVAYGLYMFGLARYRKTIYS